MKILLLEDDKILSESLQEYLELEGFVVDIAFDGEEVLNKTFDNSYDLYIFDVGVPKLDGFSLLKELKTSGDTTPTIYITAKIDINSISKGFSLGAEDYIKKPFDPEELVLRIKAKFLGRDNFLKYKDIRYNPLTKELYKGKTPIFLGEIQLKIFEKLLQNVGRIVNSFELMEFLDSPTTNALRVHITKLKSTLDIEIKNKRAQGYILEKL